MIPVATGRCTRMSPANGFKLDFLLDHEALRVIAEVYNLQDRRVYSQRTGSEYHPKHKWWSMIANDQVNWAWSAQDKGIERKMKFGSG